MRNGLEETMMERVLEIKEALSIVLELVPLMGAERVPLDQACGRALRQHAVSDCDLPTADVSTMDGYAVRKSDITDAGPETPAKLSIVETIGAGFLPELEVAPGQAARIMTGAVVPKGADYVVRSEDAREQGDIVVISAPPRQGKDNIRKRGEDYKNGDVVIRSGVMLKPGDVGLLASTGHVGVSASRKPAIGILVTGSEIIGVDEPAAPGMVRNSNGYVLSARVREIGADVKIMKVVKDEKLEIEDAILSAVESCDVVITTGGASKGRYDHVRATVEKLGRVVFSQVNIRPGRGTVFGVISGKPVFGLPGGPGANAMGMELFVYPALMKMIDAAETEIARMVGAPARGFSMSDFCEQALVPAVAEKTASGYALTPCVRGKSKPNCMAFRPDLNEADSACGLLEFFLLSPISTVR